jgi:polar amino acid transport system permease protein
MTTATPLPDLLTLLLPPLLSGAQAAVLIGAGAFCVAVSLGLALAVALTFSPFRILRWAICAYVEWLRNVPALAHLFVIYFGLASIGLKLPPIPAAIAGLGLVGSAVLADVFASGLRALHAGQREAALAVGLTPRQCLRCILLPQALRITLPPLGNYASQLLKDTSIASAIAAPEIMFYARNLVTSTFQTSLIYLLVILIYAALLLPVGWAFGRLERRLDRRPL